MKTLLIVFSVIWLSVWGYFYTKLAYVESEKYLKNVSNKNIPFVMENLNNNKRI